MLIRYLPMVIIIRGKSRRGDQCRLCARLLAFFATLWAVFCAVFVVAGSSRALLIFAPGYIVTAGYYWRGFGRPSRGWRRAIWCTSLLVHGTWLGCVLAASLAGPIGGGLSGLIVVAWWSVATAVSIIAIRLEDDDAATA
jgi:hypothetical protein